MQIRLAASTDVESIGSIRVEAWKVAYRPFMPDHYLNALDPVADLESLRSALETTPAPFLVRIADASGQAIGFSILGPLRQVTSTAGSAELWALNVHPSHWRRGVAQNLLRRAVADARDNGHSTLELWCIDGNHPAQALYEAGGFGRTGQRRTSSVLTGHPLREVEYRLVVGN